MGFRINTNIAAMNAHRNASQTNLGLDKSLQALSSGLRINKAADDASGLAIANSLRQQSSGLGQAINNANDGIGVVQTADGALDEYTNILNTVRTKAIQAASDGQSADTRLKIQSDIDRLLEAAQSIAATTSFNGQTLLNGAFENKTFHIGAYSGETVNISIDDTQLDKVAEFATDDGTALKANVTAGSTTTSIISITAAQADGTFVTVVATVTSTGVSTSRQNAQEIVDAFNEESQIQGSGVRASVFTVSASAGTYSVRLDAPEAWTGASAGDLGGVGAGTKGLTNNIGTVDVKTQDKAELSIIKADYALKDLDNVRSDIGSVQNQLESTIRNISITQVNVSAAESQIRDVDFAKESANFSKLNILAQSGSYALSQANAVQQNVLRLLQ